MLRRYEKIELDVIGLGDILSRLTGTYKVRVEAMSEPLVLADGEEITQKVHFTVPRMAGEDCSTPHEHFIDELAAMFLAQMVRAGKCQVA